MVRGRILSAAVFFVPAFLFAGPAFGLPLDAAEGTDFANVNSGTRDLGSLDVGVNRVTGSMDGPGGDLADFWDAALPTGTEITAVEILVSNSNGTSWRAIAEDAVVSSGFSTVGAWLTTNATGLQSLPATQGAFPFQAGHYYFATVSFNVAVFDYEWRVHVASVPEPGTLALLCLALAGAARARVRRG